MVGFYALGVMWLIVKYRTLLANRSPPLYMLAEVGPALAVTAATVVAPNVPFGDEPWCPALHIPPLATSALLLSVMAPLFSHVLFWPGAAVVSAILTTAYAGRAGCVSTAAATAGTAAIATLVRLHWYTKGCPETTIYETLVPSWWRQRQAGEKLYTKPSLFQ